MKETDVRSWLKKNQAFYIRLYGLQDWDIQVILRDTDGDLLGSCNAQYEYRQATITLVSEALDSELDLIETFLHELEHVLLSPLDIFRKVADANVKFSVKKTMDIVAEDMNEAARSMIGQFRKNALQLNESRRRKKH